MKQTFNGTIEVYRYVFTLIVCLMHLYYNFWGKGDLFAGGYLSVDFFFVLSGFFLPLSSKKYSSPYRYALFRYLGMMFIIITAIVIGVLLASKGQIRDIPSLMVRAIPELLCLQMTGVFYPVFVGVMWYISSMLIAGFFISALYNYSSNEKFFIELLAPVIILVGYAYIYHQVGNLDAVGKDEAGVIPLGTIRAFSGMSLGVILSKVGEIKNKTINDILQLIMLSGILMLVLMQDHTKLDFLTLLLCPVLILTLLNRETKANSLTDKIGMKLSNLMGRQFTLSMYVFSALTYHVLGMFIDFVSIGRLKAALIYLPVLVVVSLVVSKLSDLVTPKIKKLIVYDTSVS